MMKFAKIGLLFLLTILILSCVAKYNLTQQDNIGDNEGIIITKIHNNVNGLWACIFEKNKRFEKGCIGGEWAREYLYVIAIKAGELYFGEIRYSGTAELEPGYFTVESDTITYVGDLYLDVATDIWGGHVQTRMLDAEKETIAEARNEFPWLFEKYRYRKSIPVMQIDTVEGYEEVEEIKKLKSNE